MTDIQKAIKFAESEIKSLELAPEINGCEMTEWWREQIKIWETAISALKKQIPKKPIADKERMITIYRCGCGSHLATLCDKDVIVGIMQNYCSNCGQALDWGDTE